MSGLQAELMQQKVSVALTNEETVFCTKMIVECPLEINNVISKVDLLVFVFLGLNIILGMDWLFRHFASINCQQRTVTSRMPGMEDNRVFWGNMLQSMPRMITSLQAKNELASGFKAYLVHLVHKKKESTEVRCILVIRNFPKVWGELPELPPPRELRFLIELEPGIVLVHKAPYRMTPIKLKELKSCDSPRPRLGLDGV
ncbi:uncharacterized protein LOC118349659 [Juglans regia]|uniref:Uncharacterized protein LOC118349659 n=1 Tax=Juglans regia TaxID=51240 RepID=A0A6P9EQM2_JUGRE|nr:uncharacterized protein LOC118349659 [Juglans regia]